MGHTVLMQSKYLSWTMSHCWNQDGTLFSSVCSVVIGLSIFVAIVSVFCIFRITIMCRKLKKQTEEEKMKLPAQCVIWPIFGSHGFSEKIHQFFAVFFLSFLYSYLFGYSFQIQLMNQQKYAIRDLEFINPCGEQYISPILMLTNRTCEIIRIYHVSFFFHNLNRPVFQTELKIGKKS